MTQWALKAWCSNEAMSSEMVEQGVMTTFSPESGGGPKMTSMPHLVCMMDQHPIQGAYPALPQGCQDRFWIHPYHPSVHYVYRLCARVMGRLEAGYTQGRTPIYHRTNTEIYNHFNTCGQFEQQVFELWEETLAPRGNPKAQGEHVNVIQKGPRPPPGSKQTRIKVKAS